MAIPQLRVIDAGGRKPYTNAAPSTANGEMVVHEQLAAAIEGVGWKDNARVASVANVTIASPGATIDGITMTVNDRVLLKNQTAQAENGIYIWNGAATPMTRALDASTFDELESAVITIDEGTNAGTTWRQTQVNGTIGTNNVVFSSFGSGAGPASETTSGIAELATQAETDAGTDDLRIVTPLKFKTSSLRAKGFSSTIGDGSATSIAVTHNLNTTDVQVTVRELTGSLREVIAEVQYTSVNVVTVLFDAAPASNSLRVNVGTLPA
jgi:hypothetical protein